MNERTLRASNKRTFSRISIIFNEQNFMVSLVTDNSFKKELKYASEVDYFNVQGEQQQYS